MKVRRRNILILGIVGGALIIFIALFGAINQDNAPVFNLVLFAGLIVVTMFYAYYSMETADAAREQAEASVKMAEEMREQRIMTSRPVIIQKAVPLQFIDEDTGTSDNFQIYNAGNGPAIELEILLLDKDKKLLAGQRETFLQAGDAIKDFYPAGLGEHVNSDCYLLCRYQSIQSIGTKPSWYQTWLPFKPVKSKSKDYIYIRSGELEFEEVFEKRSF